MKALAHLLPLGALVALTAHGAPPAWRHEAKSAPASTANLIAAGGNAPHGYDMAPITTLKVVEAAVAQIPTPMAPGPIKPTWKSLQEHYRVPAWFYRAKFGLFMHWGIYSVPAHHNEWYEKHMYSSELAWHTAHYGPPDKFGYKDFIPMFTAAKWHPNAWARLFKASGAKFVIPTAQHHDGFALWDSQVTPYNAVKMGPHRDLIGDLAKAVRAQGLKFGVSNHEMENFEFVNPTPALKAKLKAEHADLYDPKWEDFYHVADRSNAALEKFLVNWYERNVELIDKYRPDILWFDNGVDQRYLDPLKLRVAAYYYNRALQWGKQVSISTKKAAYAPSNDNTHTIGSIIDFEKIGPRSPAGIRTGAWEVDQPIGSTWGYTRNMRVSGPGAIIAALADTVSKNGTLLLNLSPRADGTFPQAQQRTLLAVGAWLRTNGEAIYCTHNWIDFGFGSLRDRTGPRVRFTVKGDALYAIVLGRPEGTELVLPPLATTAGLQGRVEDVSLLGGAGPLPFRQDQRGLAVELPASAPSEYAYVLKITGPRMNPPVDPPDGNPQL